MPCESTTGQGVIAKGSLLSGTRRVPGILQEMYADAFQDNPEDNIQWAELYLKVIENDCPAFAANGLLHPNYHRPKPKTTLATRSAVTSHSVARSSIRTLDARSETLTVLQTEIMSTSPTRRTHRRHNLADETWLQARGWSRDDKGLWSNAEPLFRCQCCESAGQLCKFMDTSFKAPDGGGLSLISCNQCFPKKKRCSVSSRLSGTRYFWVQMEDGGGYQWKSEMKGVGKRERGRNNVYIPRRRRSVSPELHANGSCGDNLDSSTDILVRHPSTQSVCGWSAC
jgi:hypothetical protein